MVKATKTKKQKTTLEILETIFGGLTYDTVFKKFFTDMTDVCSIILSEILRIRILPKNMIFINTELLGETKDRKKSFLDLEVKLPSGEHIII